MAKSLLTFAIWSKRLSSVDTFLSFCNYCAATPVKMSLAHLAAGSVEPPRVDGLLRLYSMKLCPYAQRSRLVLNAKGIPHDLVNINLGKKPEWYFKIHPEGKVPAILEGDKITVESLDICDYLDEKYPENPLYPADPEAKRRDKELIQKIDTITSVFWRCLTSADEKNAEEWLKEFLPPLQVFEDELARRGTTFFGGEKPGMVDYMLCPWGERAPLIPLRLGGKLPLKDGQIPRLRKWRKSMRNIPVCAEIYTSPEKLWNFYQNWFKGGEADYDNI